MIRTFSPPLRRHGLRVGLPLAALLLALSLPPRLAPSGALARPAAHPLPRVGGSWTPVGPLLEPLGLQTATLLPTGQVLLAGGTGLDLLPHALQAELYLPATGTFSYTGVIPLSGHVSLDQNTATRLRNGQVLVAGGDSGQYGLTNANLYDPATQQFSGTGALLVPRVQHVAALLATGQVLIAGGCNGTSDGCTTAWSSAELYTPATGTFTPTGAMSIARMNATATPLYNGQVLIAGGAPCVACVGLPTAELYTPATGTFTPTRGQMHVGRALHTATLLPNGEVLIAGGCTQYHEDCYPPSGTLRSAELYNPRTQQFTLIGYMTTPRYSHTATLLRNGQVLIAGGAQNGTCTDFGCPLSSAELYHPLTGRFTAIAPMTAVHASGSATLLANGQVLVVGGCIINNSCIDRPSIAVDLYTP